MSYQLRNSIVLGVLLFIILSVGTYVRGFYFPKKISVIETEVKRIDDELQNTPALINQFNELSDDLEARKSRWEGRNKDIPPVDVTSQTYGYFSRLIDLSGELKLDLLYNGSQAAGNYGFNVYNLKGEGPFAHVYKFIWYLENGRKLFKIKNLNMKGLELAASEEQAGGVIVTFEMTVHAMYSSVAELSSSLGERAIAPNYLFKDPFVPVITAGIPPNIRSLIEVERSDLKAVILGKAFLVDQMNTFRTVEVGDEVYLGYVTKISPEKGRIECTLNKGGVIEIVELKIRYGTPQNGVPQQN